MGRGMSFDDRSSSEQDWRMHQESDPSNEWLEDAVEAVSYPLVISFNNHEYVEVLLDPPEGVLHQLPLSLNVTLLLNGPWNAEGLEGPCDSSFPKIAGVRLTEVSECISESLVGKIAALSVRALVEACFVASEAGRSAQRTQVGECLLRTIPQGLLVSGEIVGAE